MNEETGFRASELPLEVWRMWTEGIVFMVFGPKIANKHLRKTFSRVITVTERQKS